jgi:hypothetical protein
MRPQRPGPVAKGETFMSKKLTGKRFVRAVPVGSTVVVHETRYIGHPVFWVGVVSSHPCDEDGTPHRLPIVRLVAKPKAGHITDWWILGKSYQKPDLEVLTLDEARQKFGDQPEFVESPRIPSVCPNASCVSRLNDATAPVGAPCAVCGEDLA